VGRAPCRRAAQNGLSVTTFASTLHPATRPIAVRSWGSPASAADSRRAAQAMRRAEPFLRCDAATTPPRLHRLQRTQAEHRAAARGKVLGAHGLTTPRSPLVPRPFAPVKGRRGSPRREARTGVLRWGHRAHATECGS